MESGFPMLNCLLQQALRSLCACNSDSSSKWAYAVFWRILPRNYPPPKWDHGGGALDRAKGNKRNWILVWEDGFCDFYECERTGSGYIKGRFGADVFFKMSHEVYNYGEGLVGRVAAENSHKWAFSCSSNEDDPTFPSSWNVPIDPQPRAWEFQFSSGIQTIAIISVREGIIQLGSFDKIIEDLNLVISIQRKFSYLQSIPGIYAIQRPYLPIQHPYTFKPNNPHFMIESNETADEKRQLKFVNLGYNDSPRISVQPPPPWAIPPLLPSIRSFGAFSSNLPSGAPSYNAPALFDNNKSTSRSGGLIEAQNIDLKMESSNGVDAAHQEKSGSLNPNSDVNVMAELGFGGPIREEESVLNPN